MEFSIEEILENAVESKGLGKKLEQMPTPAGLADVFEQHASLLKYDDGFNVVVMNTLLTESCPDCKLHYLFTEPVSEEKARKTYDGLK